MILEKYSKYFPQEKFFVIQILDVVFEVETELYVYMFVTWIPWLKESVLRAVWKNGSEYWEKVHGVRDIIWKYFAVVLMCFKQRSFYIHKYIQEHTDVKVMYLQFQKVFLGDWRVCLLPLIGNRLVKPNTVNKLGYTPYIYNRSCILGT
jgi:hypothetical protein